MVRWPKTTWKTFEETSRRSQNGCIKAYLVADDDDEDDDDDVWLALAKDCVTK